MSAEPRDLCQEGGSLEMARKSPAKQRASPRRHLDYSPVKSTLKEACSYWTCRKDGVPCKDKQKIGVLVMLCTSCIAFVGAVLLWTTDIAHNLTLSALVIKNDTQLYDWWKDPPVETTYTLRVFNYTNSDAYLNGKDKKLKLVEIGPYVYRSRRTKVYVEFDEDGEIVTFQDNRTYEFLPDQSIGVSEDDQVIVPNLPLLGSASVMHDSHYIVRMGLATILKTMKVEPFMKMRVGDFFWGYDDPLFNLARNVVPSFSDVPFEDFGLMAAISGVSRDRVSIHTGLKDKKKLGVISKFNGENSLPYWNGYECNRVDGSEGSIFPLLALPKIKIPPPTTKAEAIQEENITEKPEGNNGHHNDTDRSHPEEKSDQLRLTLFNYELCRRFPIVPSEEVEAFGFPAIRFRPAEDVFDDAVKNPRHKCFCDPEQSTCPPSGVFNETPCAYGAPIMLSFPHFYSAEKSLLESFEGLNPVKELHEFSMDILPGLGLPLGGKTRLQLNAMVRKGIWQLNGFPKNLIIPISWFEMEVKDLPEDIRSAIRMVTHTLPQAQQATRWLLLGLSFVLMVAVIALITKRARAECKENRSKKMVLSTDPGKQEEMAFLDRNS
ncbi:scavenger receptor class B member 1-like [Ischnura elegans]|uniref:scavenger receptor class B member 1-like n=1 Tax=Ischnura elegans TaxID=197161 RepID=UPI001ED8A392|nr:scavenger receptor class B member 1-like [Ischnura elegans]